MPSCPDTAWMRSGHALDMSGTRILHLESEISDTIWHDSHLKRLGIMEHML